jgi:uncharacterized DUF497 family protein
VSYEFDPVKDRSNLDKHGLSIVDADVFKWETAVVHKDARRQYAELRFEAIGYIGNRLHVMVFCLRAETVRIISLPKANSREVTDYAKI